MTEQNLRDAYSGESQAHMKYLIYADVADKEGKANIARMFRAIALAERVHATAHLRELGEVNKTAENLGVAVSGENFEVDEMYPAYHKVAEMQEEKGAVRTTGYAWEAEKIHARMFTAARQASDADQDITVDTIHVCPVCGYTGEGESPGRCPVCASSGKAFKLFPAE
jgi:rubrerythrin